jgi:hypothetical protein
MSMMPEYYREKISVALLWGPAGRMTNTRSSFFVGFGRILVKFKFLLVDTLHVYRFFEPNMLE